MMSKAQKRNVKGQPIAQVFTSEKVEALIKSNSGQIFFTQYGKDNFYKHCCYSEIRDENSTIKLDFICCMKCSSILSNFGGNGGSHITRHRKQCEAKEIAKNNQPHMTQFLAPVGTQQTVPVKLPKDLESKLVSLVSTFSMDSGSSFRSCETEAMRKYSAGLIKFGMDIKDHTLNPSTFDLERSMPSRKVVKSNAVKIAKIRIDSITPEILFAIEKGLACVGVDFVKRLGNDYVGLVLYYSTVAGIRKILPIGLMRCNQEDRKDSATMLRQIQQAVSTFGVKSNFLSNIYSISDQEAALSKALRTNSKSAFHCACHVLCTIVKRVFEPLVTVELNKDEIETCTRANELVVACKTVAEACKINGLIRRTVSLLPRIPPDNRWLYHLQLIEGCIKISDDLATLLEPARKREFSELSDNLKQKITTLVNRRSELKTLCTFLEPFQVAVKSLESNDVLLDQVLTWCRKLKLILKYMQNSYDQFLSSLASIGLKVFNEKIVNQSFLRKEHFMAVILKPSSKKMSAKFELPDGSKERLFTEEDKENALRYVKSEMHTYPATKISNAAISNGNGTDDSGSEDEALDEFQIYLNDRDKDKDVFAYWHQNSKYPILAQIAIKIFIVPTSAAEVERFFSNLRYVIDDYRYNLDAETSSMLMLGKYCKEG